MSFLGDFKLGDTFDTKFVTTAAATGAPTQLAGSPVISAYPGNSTTELTAGITLSVDFDSRTGLNNVRVVATTGNGYAAATNYQLVITTGTVGGTSAVGYVVGEFSIENRVVNIASLPILTGTYPAYGIGDAGTAQAAASTTLQARAASPAFGTNTCAGQILAAFGSTQGYWQARKVLSNTSGAGGTFTVDAFTVTPTGTITYVLFNSPPDASLTTALATIAKLEAAFASSGVFSTAALANGPVGTFIRTGSCTTTGTTSSFTDSAITETGTNKLLGKTILWTSGSNVGASCRITASVNTAVSVTPAMAATITSGDAYKLYHDAVSLVSDPSVTAIGAGVIATTVDGSVTLAESLRLANALDGGKTNGLVLGVGTMNVRDLADTKNRVVAVVDANGNRTTVTRDLA